MIDRQRLALGSGVETGLDDIYYVVTWTANQSGLVTLTFDLLTLKVASESRVMWVTYMPILVFLGLCNFELGPMYATDRQSSDKSIAYCPRLLDIITQKELFNTEWSCLCCSRDVCIIDSDTEIIRFIFTGNLKKCEYWIEKVFFMSWRPSRVLALIDWLKVTLISSTEIRLAQQPDADSKKEETEVLRTYHQKVYIWKRTSLKEWSQDPEHVEEQRRIVWTMLRHELD